MKWTHVCQQLGLLQLLVPSWRENHIEPLCEEAAFVPPEVRRTWKKHPKQLPSSPSIYAPQHLSFPSSSCWKMACIWNATWSSSWMRKEGKGTNVLHHLCCSYRNETLDWAWTCRVRTGLCVKSSCFASSVGPRFSVAFERSGGTFSESESSACFSDCSSAWTGRKSSQRLSRSFHPSTPTPKMVGPHSRRLPAECFLHILTFVSPLAVETIVITPFLPVVAFGRPLPKLSQE